MASSRKTSTDTQRELVSLRETSTDTQRELTSLRETSQQEMASLRETSINTQRELTSVRETSTDTQRELTSLSETSTETEQELTSLRETSTKTQRELTCLKETSQHEIASLRKGTSEIQRGLRGDVQSLSNKANELRCQMDLITISQPDDSFERYESMKLALQKDLVQYYRHKSSALPLSILRPDLDEELDALYVQPKITVVQVRKKINDSKDIKGKDILTYQDLFGIGKLRNIYIQGNPGMGKSTYCTKLTLDWCTYIETRSSGKEIQEENCIAGLDFDFLFLISLRESADETCKVYQIVKNAVIEHLSQGPEPEYNDMFLSKVLNKERCLIALDGLDEWSHPENGNCKVSEEQKHIPHRSAVGNCVYLTLTRPWKLNQVCLKDSEIDVLLEISGVREPEELITKVINSLNNKVEENSMDLQKFKSATKHLSSLATVPIIAVQLVCIWHESEEIPSSQTGIYCSIMKMMLERKKVDTLTSKQILAVNMPKCFYSMKWFEPEKRIQEQLGKLAFETLFPEDGQSSQVVFTGTTLSRHLGEEIKKTALTAGLITEYKIRLLNQKKSQLSFLHKTFQEFLAAFYLSLHSDQNKELVSRVKIQGENINDISQLFTFLCGMTPTLATPVSKVLMAATTRSLKKNRDEKIVKNITELINVGFAECVQNEHDNVCLETIHIYFGRDKENKVYQPQEKLLQQNLKKIETIWCEDKEFYQKVFVILNSSSKTITTLCLPYVDNSVDLNMCHCLQAFRIPYRRYHYKRPAMCLDMSKCQLLEYLHIEQNNLALNINTDQLHYCGLWNCDLSQGNIVETLTKRNSKLRHLTLHRCRFSSEGISCHLDLTSCRSMEKLRIDCDISVSINTTNLLTCSLENIDLSQGNLLEALNNSTQLTRLWLEECHFPADKRPKNHVYIDISACTNLSEIYVTYSDVIVKYKEYEGVRHLWWSKDE